jgi:hypothetical protein
MSHGGKRSYTVHRFETTTPNKVIEVAVTYSTAQRAYYMHVTPMTIERAPDGLEVKSFKLFSGGKVKIEEVKRYNEKYFLSLVERAQEECQRRDPNIMRALYHVLRTEQLALVDDVPALMSTTET